MASPDELQSLDRLFVRQKFSPFVNKYRISSVAADGKSEGEPVAFVQQKRLKIREEINFFSDDHKKQRILQLKKRNIMEFQGRTDVKLDDGTVIGQLQKVFGKSLFRSSWQLLDADGNTVATAQEQSFFIAILRRVWSALPVVGDIPFVIPFHFDIAIDGTTVGTYRRIWALTDRYILDLSGDTERRIDRRVALTFTVALDALQDR